MLGGPVLLLSSSRYASTTAHLGQPAFTDSQRYSGTDVSLALGAAVRYALTPRVALAFDLLANAGLGDGYSDFGDRLYSNVLAEVHYRLGQ